MLVNSKYEDPIRTDSIPEDQETLWRVKYQPNGERSEVTQYMYLRFRRGGNVHGVGYEESRKLCKITGKYKLNARTNQTALALQCKFSNECDTVLFHGWGNGTGLVGNCYIREIDPFSAFSGIPGIRQLSRDKYKGSFLMLKQSGMGGAKLRSMVHTRRVHKWAGACFPDDSVPMPQSPMRSPGATPRSGITPKSSRGRGAGRENGYSPVEGQGSTRGGRGRRGFARSTARPGSPATSQGGSNKSDSLGKKIRRLFHRKRPTLDIQLQDRTSDWSTRGSTSGEVPPWVRQGTPGSEEAEMTELRGGYHGGHARRRTGYDDDDDDGNGNGGSMYGYSPSSTSRPSTAGGKRSKPVQTANYLDLEGVRASTTPCLLGGGALGEEVDSAVELFPPESRVI
ncbi:expressed unknown protein [Ectocarpus siliculosus]|uniref:Uncharacterized protein n=1 Tax=Ectocarpus siliculosus TaxID=2880 RepID=D8LN65_ECTSI|nr:expressed unknown protein [Ectocarpus siliculosus]|eukprot:CBN74828.1 expressed unknown protein [Ectocarpus siliculosus]